jgi:hypothetical protein
MVCDQAIEATGPVSAGREAAHSGGRRARISSIQQTGREESQGRDRVVGAKLVHGALCEDENTAKAVISRSRCNLTEAMLRVSSRNQTMRWSQLSLMQIYFAGPVALDE